MRTRPAGNRCRLKRRMNSRTGSVRFHNAALSVIAIAEGDASSLLIDAGDAPVAQGDPVRVVGELVWCLRNNYTFVALKLAWGEARRRECIPSDTRPTEQRTPRPISAQPGGRPVFWAEALLHAPHRSTAGYARRSRLASAQNPLPRMYSYFGDTTPGHTAHASRITHQ